MSSYLVLGYTKSAGMYETSPPVYKSALLLLLLLLLLLTQLGRLSIESYQVNKRTVQYTNLRICVLAV